jgi:hypothetical protein
MTFQDIRLELQTTSDLTVRRVLEAWGPVTRPEIYRAFRTNTKRRLPLWDTISVP